MEGTFALIEISLSVKKSMPHSVTSKKYILLLSSKNNRVIDEFYCTTVKNFSECDQHSLQILSENLAAPIAIVFYLLLALCDHEPMRSVTLECRDIVRIVSYQYPR